MHTEETQTPSVGPVDLDSAMFPAMLTVATSNQLPVHQGASLPTPVMCNMVSSCYRPTLLLENRFRGCRCDTLIDTVIFKLQPCSVQIIRLSEIKFYLKSNLLVLTLVLTVFNFHNESVYVICDLHIIICDLHRPQHGNESEPFFAHCGWWFSEHLDVV